MVILLAGAVGKIIKSATTLSPHDPERDRLPERRRCRDSRSTSKSIRPTCPKSPTARLDLRPGFGAGRIISSNCTDAAGTGLADSMQRAAGTAATLGHSSLDHGPTSRKKAMRLSSLLRECLASDPTPALRLPRRPLPVTHGVSAVERARDLRHRVN